MALRAVFLFYLVFSSTLAAQDPELLTLDNAIGLALQHNRSVQSAKLDTEKSSDQIAAVRTRYLPAIDFTILASRLVTPLSFRFDQGTFGNFPTTGPVPAEDTEITTEGTWTTYLVSSVQQPLSQLYEIKLNESLLKSAREETKEKEREKRQEITNQVKKSYYAVLQSQSALRYSEEQIKLYRELKRVTDDYVIQKVALKSDGMEVNARLVKAEYDVLVATNDLAERMEQLNVVLGRDIRTRFAVSPVAKPGALESDLQQAQSGALQNRPELKQAQWKLKEAEYDARIKKAEYLPDLSFSFNYLSTNNFEFLPSQFASVGIYMSWDIFDWGRKGHELAEKKRTVEQARLGVLETENRVLADVNSNYRNVEESRKLVEVVQLAQEAAQEKLRVTANLFKEQSALLKDVLEAQTSLDETRDQYEKAVLSFWAAQADFEKAVGIEQ